MGLKGLEARAEQIEVLVGKLLKEIRAAKEAPDEASFIVSPLCKCGHSEGEHLPGCIYIVEGCECVEYEKAEAVGSPVVPAAS